MVEGENQGTPYGPGSENGFPQLPKQQSQRVASGTRCGVSWLAAVDLVTGSGSPSASGRCD